MRIKDKRRGLWFIVEVRDSDGLDHTYLVSYAELGKHLGNFHWMEDVKGIFTRYVEAENFYNLYLKRDRARRRKKIA